MNDMDDVDGMDDALALLLDEGHLVAESVTSPVLPPVGGDSVDGVEDALALLKPERAGAAGGVGVEGVADAAVLVSAGATGAGAPSAGGRGQDSDAAEGVEDALALLAPEQGAETPRTEGGGDGGGPVGPVDWAGAREIAAAAGQDARPRTERVPLAAALGRVLAEPLVALCDLPSFDTSAMDGWAVAGPGPWTVRDGSVLAGRGAVAPLEDGTAVRIATGARIPPEATAVLRSEHARTGERPGLLAADRGLPHGQDVRPRGQECRTGDRLLPAARVVNPAVLGLAAAAGYDELGVVPRPGVEVLVLGDELLATGLPYDGLIRDALGPMLVPWLEALGAEVAAVRWIGDDAGALRRAVAASTADLLVTTGGTASGPVDHVHPVLRAEGAEPLVDSVGVRPGHPMLLARLGAPLGSPAGTGTPVRHLVGLPGNPLAAVAGLLTLAEPLLRGLLGLAPPVPHRAPVDEEVPGHPRDTRLVPCVHREGRLLPLRYHGPAMLRGIAAAEGLAVVPPGGARPGDEVEVLRFPWTTPG
ncbi:molybdopterin molybdotransferase MoeA [Streptomyces yaizuensis]|uniref:Molybdopterin molybdenumtransferase n=1 Tax=Streptomyces yaizuensis TaxID=2989713 RepID=A0ABQ5P231_9ACTN|nr:molybdopterin molybdotransferase MoeA [Streptomyces sp. YSPA8]